MADVNLSARFENNLRRVSGAGVATLCAEIADDGQRLNTSAVYAAAADDYQVYNIPADSLVPKIYFIVDEAFDAGTTALISTIVDSTELVAALDLATVGASVSAVVDSYFDAVDGVNFKLNQDVTQGKVRVVCEFVSGSTNNGIYIDQGA